jgi:hypothetical protein
MLFLKKMYSTYHKFNKKANGFKLLLTQKKFNLVFVFMFKFVSFLNGILGKLLFLFTLPCLHPCIKHMINVLYTHVLNKLCATHLQQISPIGFQFYYKELCKCIAQNHILRSS